MFKLALSGIAAALVLFSGLTTASAVSPVSKPTSVSGTLVCPTGSRSSRAVALLKKAGYENVKSLSGGLGAWREANLPVEKSAA